MYPIRRRGYLAVMPAKEERREALKLVYEQARGCAKCPELAATRTQVDAPSASTHVDAPPASTHVDAPVTSTRAPAPAAASPPRRRVAKPPNPSPQRAPAVPPSPAPAAKPPVLDL